MNILIAPDKFKGTLTAEQVCNAVEQGLKKSGKRMQIKKFPLADGGEGTLDIFLWHTRGKLVEVEVHDPLMRKINAGYGISGDGKTALIEVARASGLGLLASNERNPLKTTSYGTGELIADALNRNVQEIVLGIGGTATNDAALGAVCALGAQVYDQNEELLFPIGEALQDVARIDLTSIHPGVREIRITAICDVSNSFYGETGAAYVYAPQKGASSETIEQLDTGLRNIGAVIQRQYGIDLQSVSGAGAGGGFAGGAYALMGAELRPGIEVVFDTTSFGQMVKWANVVITGEGKLDAQTFHGKVIDGVAKVAKAAGKEVYVICGSNELAEEEWKKNGIKDVFSLVRVAGIEMAMHSTAGVMEDVAYEIGRKLSKSFI